MNDASTNSDIQQQLSALMDGELDRDSTRFLLRRIEADAALKAQWQRFHLARHALRRQTDVPVSGHFAAAVMARLGDEPAPVTASRFGTWLRYATGGAIAAAVAVAALTLGKPVAVPAPAAPVVASSTAPSSAMASRVASANEASLLLPRSPAVTAQAASFGGIDQPLGIDPRLQSYLARHYEAANGAGRAGVAPYVLLLVPAPSDSAAVRRDDVSNPPR